MAPTRATRETRAPPFRQRDDSIVAAHEGDSPTTGSKFFSVAQSDLRELFQTTGLNLTKRRTSFSTISRLCARVSRYLRPLGLFVTSPPDKKEGMAHTDIIAGGQAWMAAACVRVWARREGPYPIEKSSEFEFSIGSLTKPGLLGACTHLCPVLFHHVTVVLIHSFFN